MRAALLALALVLAPPARAEDLRATFDLWLGGIHGAELDLDVRWRGAAFAAVSELRTTGLVDLFYAGFYRVSAEGRAEGERLLPVRFEADSAFGDDRQKVTVVWGEEGPESVAAMPAFRARPWAVEPRDQTGTLDPLTAALALLRPEPAAAVCNRSVEIFDGRRVSRITLGAPREAGGRVTCPATYERVRGFSPKMMRRQTRWDLTVTFRVRPDGVAEILEMSGETGFGLAVVTRRG